MIKLLLLFTVISTTSLFAQHNTDRKVLSLMGSRFELVAVHKNELIRHEAIEAAIMEIRRIENLISSWDPNSATSLINRNAGIKPVQIPLELFNLIERANKVSKLTDGAFDISFSSIDPVWIFDGKTMDPPDSSVIAASAQNINYKNILLNRARQTVMLKNQGMKIGFGAIGKGYAANSAKKTMIQKGITDGMINAGGDLIAWGNQGDGTPWKIGIADPTKNKEYIAWLTASNQSIVTSGNYEKYVIIHGHKYGHIINPKTGYPVTGIQSVTIISPDAELSDALATSVFVLGVEKGLSLINQLKSTECLIIDDENQIWKSSKLQLNYY